MKGLTHFQQAHIIPWFHWKALNNLDPSQVFEPARLRTYTQTPVLTETASDCNVALPDVM